MFLLNDSIGHHIVINFNHVADFVLIFSTLKRSFYAIYVAHDVNFFHNKVHLHAENTCNNFFIAVTLNYHYSSDLHYNKKHESFSDKQFNECYDLYFQVNNNLQILSDFNHVLNYAGYLLPIYTNGVHSNWDSFIVQDVKFYAVDIVQNRTDVFVIIVYLDLVFEDVEDVT